MEELDYVHAKIREQMESWADHLATGSCKSFDEYKYYTGVIAGLAVSEREILDLKERATRAD